MCSSCLNYYRFLLPFSITIHCGERRDWNADYFCEKKGRPTRLGSSCSRRRLGVRLRHRNFFPFFCRSSSSKVVFPPPPPRAHAHRPSHKRSQLWSQTSADSPRNSSLVIQRGGERGAKKKVAHHLPSSIVLCAAAACRVCSVTSTAAAAAAATMMTTASATATATADGANTAAYLFAQSSPFALPPLPHRHGRCFLLSPLCCRPLSLSSVSCSRLSQRVPVSLTAEPKLLPPFCWTKELSSLGRTSDGGRRNVLPAR